MNRPLACAGLSCPAIRAAALFAFCGFAAMDVRSEPLTFVDAVARAIRESPDVSARAAAFAAAQSLVTPAGELPDPELVIGVDNLPITGPDSGSLTNDFMTMRKVGLMQTFVSGAKRTARRQRANDAVQLARAEEIFTELDIKRDAAQAWIGVYTAEKALAALRALEPDLELQTRIANSGVSSSQLSMEDALEAQRALVAFGDRLRVGERDVRRARAELARWLPQDADRPLGDPPDFAVLPEGQRLTNVSHHASLAAYEAQVDVARSEVALTQAEKHPDWSAGLMYSKRGPLYSDMVSLEFRVGLPLFPGSRQNPAIAAKRAELRQLQAQQAAELRMHTAEVTQTIADWETLKARSSAYRTELLPLAHQRVQLALASLRSGKAGVKSVLDARAAEVDVQLQTIELEGELGRNWAFLNYLQKEGANP